MTAVLGGSYRGASDGLVVDVRVVRDARDALVAIGGDVSVGDDFITSFTSTSARDDGDSAATAEIAFRGHPALKTGSVRVEVDERGIGAFQLGVDLDGGYRDVFAGSLERQGDFLRRLDVEIDGIDGAQPPTGYPSAGGSTVTIESAYSRAGFDVAVTVDPFVGRGPEPTFVRGWTMAEIHRAMEDAREPRRPDRLSVHVFVCSYMAGKPGVLGIMYDFGRDDLNRIPREGVAVFYDHRMLSDPHIPQDTRDREYVYTCVHEIGHALNMLHSFDKGRPSALSWMNYPDLYPRGHEAPQGHDGSREFWQRFRETFDDQEIRHLHFATLREIRPGGLPFGVYEDGPSTVFGGPADPHLARPGANPLRATTDVSLSVGFAKRAYLLGEPVIATIGVRNAGGATAVVPRGLDPSDGHVTITVVRPRGDAVRFRPPVQLCQEAAFARLSPGEATARFDHSPLFLSAQGPVFTEAGTYEVRAELTGVNGNRVAYARPVRIDVFCPDRVVDAVAREAFARTDFLRALYLRHPLAAIDGWRDFEKVLEAAREQLPPEHTLAAYVDYVAAQGWMTEFASPTEPTSPADREKARQRVTRASRGRDALPGAVARLEGAVAAEGPPSRRTARVFVGAEPVAAPLRVVVPPAGLFGTLGLDESGKPAAQPGAPVSPFERVVKTLKGSTRFADVVSWNIEHLHSNRWKVQAVADLIRDFRCDFWGLQEVDEGSLQELVAALNEGGRTKYAYVVACACSTCRTACSTRRSTLSSREAARRAVRSSSAPPSSARFASRNARGGCSTSARASST